MAPATEVRAARREDVPAAARLAAELVRLHHRFDPDRFLCVEPLEQGYAPFLATQVGRRGRVLAGLEGRDCMDLRDACGKLYDLYVDPAARGGGIGGRLVEETVARLVARGAPRVVLMTAWLNEDARRLFARLGFRPTMLEMTREAAG